MPLVAGNVFYAEGGNWYDFADEEIVPAPVFPVNPGVVVNEARLASIDYLSSPWAAGYNKLNSTSGPQSVASIRTAYRRFSALNYDGSYAINPGTRILGGADAGMPVGAPADGYHVCARDDGVACAVQAYMWRVTGNTTYRNNAIAILNNYKNVTSFGPGGPLQNTAYKPLAIALGMESMVQALSVLGDFPDRGEIVSNFATYWWPAMYHWTGGNWLASFANARMGIAIAAGDATLWAQSLDYFDQVIKANIWITEDGALVNKLPKNESNGAEQSASAYPAHWWHRTVTADSPAGTIDTVPTTRSSAALANGQNCEFTRDDGHEMMQLGGLMNGVWTVQHQTGTGLAVYKDRITRAFELTAGNIIAKLDASQTPTGGRGWIQGWLPALAAYGPTVLPNVMALTSRDAEIPVPFTANQNVAQGLLFPIGT
jgi:hypothetical protein